MENHMIRQANYLGWKMARGFMQFITDEEGDEILQKAAVIALATVAIIALGALFAAAVGAFERGASWFN
jgi:hypothetical protein